MIQQLSHLKHGDFILPMLDGTANQVLTTDGNGVVTWATQQTGSNSFLSALSFDTATGVLTGTVTGADNVTVDLDNRYALSGHTHDYDNYKFFNLKTNGVQRTTVQSEGTLDLIAGSNVALSYSAGGKVSISSTDTNHYLSGASFNTGNGKLTLTVNGNTNQIVDLDGRYEYQGHKYHSFSNGQQFYDSYGQSKYLRLFTENAVYDTFRFRSYSDVEFWNGSSWEKWTQSLDTLLDGREETGLRLQHANKRFRFVINRSSGWPTTALFVLQGSWSDISAQTCSVKLETQDGDTWNEKTNWTYSDFQQGMNLNTTTSLHDGKNQMRVEIDIDWTDGSHDYYSLRNLFLLSNFSGGQTLDPWTWDYNGSVNFQALPKSAGDNLATQTWVGSQDYASGSHDHDSDYVNITGDTMTGNLSIKGDILLTGDPTTTNQSRMIDFTGFDKEGTTDFSDKAYIRHTQGVGGHSGSTLEISSQNDSGDGIAFTTHASSLLKHNGNAIFSTGHKPTWNEVEDKPTTFNPSSHNHDGRYLKLNSRLNANGDTITASGIHIWDVSGATDDPVGASDGLLTTKYWDSQNWAVQMFEDFHQRELHIRNKREGTWQKDWAQVHTTDNFSTTDVANGVTAHGWGNHASENYLTSVTNVTGYSGTLLSSDNRLIKPSEETSGRMKFGFTSWDNNSSGVYADFLHLRSYQDSSGGNDNLVMFKKSGIGMRIWQAAWNSTDAYSSYEDVWTTGGITTTQVANWDTAHGWGDHADAGYTGDQNLSGYLLNTTDTFAGTLTVSSKILAKGEIINSSAALQVNGFQRTGNIYLHSGGNTPDTAHSEVIISNVSGNLLINKDISASNLSGTNTGDQDLSGLAVGDLDHYLLNTTDTFAGNLTFNGGNNNSKESFINVKRGSGAGEWLKFQTDSTSANNVSQFVIRRNSDNVDILSINAGSGNLTVPGTLSASGYNKTNWDTAHGWGDHSTEGYTKTDTVFDGGPVENPIIVDNRSATSILHWAVSGSSTGAIKITLPGKHVGNYSMMVLRVTLYEYTGEAHTTYTVSGHDWTSGWVNKAIKKWGNSSKNIDFAFSTGEDKDYILLGETDSTWSYGHVTVDLIAHPSFYSGSMDVETGWKIEQVTDFEGITRANYKNDSVYDTGDFANNSANWNTAYTHSLKAHAPSNAEANVQSDWNATTGDSFIKNKPSTFAPSSHNHTSLTGVTNLTFAAQSSDAASITTTIDSTHTYFDFNLTDDNNNDWWRWRFTPSGSTLYDAMVLKPASNGNANLIVSGNVTADNIPTSYAPVNAQKNVQSNWDATSGDAFILNKPNLAFNTIIGTDADINTSGNTIINNLYMTDGVITSHTTRVLKATDLGITKPLKPTELTLSIVNDTINVTFSKSTESPLDAYLTADNYLVFSSVAGGSYGLISVFSPEDMDEIMSVIDNSFSTSGTISYRVYAVRKGIYSDPATAEINYVKPKTEVSNIKSVNFLSAHFVQWDEPAINSKFLKSYEVYYDSHDISGSLSKANAKLIYSGTNTSYMHSVEQDVKFSQFWVEVIYN